MRDHKTYLCHHGIKGQKWGVRRFQNDDGSLTQAGRARYGIAEKSINARIKEIERRLEKVSSEKSTAAMLKAQRLRSQITAIRSERFSSSQKNAKRKYMSSGKSEEEAERLAYRDRAVKTLLVAAGAVGVGVAVAYAMKRHRVDADTIISKGSRIQTVSLNADRSFDTPFYAAFTKNDKKKYEGLYGGYQLQVGGSKTVHVIGTQASRNLRIAGAKTARKQVNELLRNDKEYAKAISDAALKKVLTTTSRENRGYSNLKKTIAKRANLDRKGYELVNSVLNQHTKNGEVAANKLYEALRKKRYDGVLDIHDQVSSGYNAKAPVILFGELSNYTGRSVNSISSRTAKKKAVRFIAVMAGVHVGRSAAGSVVGKNVKSQIRTAAAKNELVAQYKHMHPNTKLTDKQILEVQLKR